MDRKALVRKIRCDALPEGCSHCINQNLECYVTDRVTGRTERRGYMQELEREKTDMLNHIRALEKLLGNTGVDVKPFQWSSYQSASYPSSIVFDSAGNPISDSAITNSNDSNSNGNDTIHCSDSGSTIDINSFDAPDMDEPPPNVAARAPLYNKSLQAMMQSALNVNPPLHVEYPPKTDAFTYAEWYFLMIYPFLPILHKPTFMTLLTRLYDDPSFVPTPAETVMVHMVYASIYLQYGIRQEQPDQKARLHGMSNNHYHFALSKFFDLATSRTVPDLQALTMIALHTSRFPKTDCSHMLTSYAIGMATELNLHRAFKKAGEGTNLENEMRKRIWWCLTSTAIVNSGRMGRPMPLRLEECDVDFPEPIADELLMRDGVDTTRSLKCPYEAGVAAHKISALYLEMYSNIYAARRDPKRYLPVIDALEEQLQIWKDTLPESLKLDDVDRVEHEGHMFALYMRFLANEFRLCLRHPSLTLGADPKMIAENAKICEATAKDMLKTLHSLYRLKCLDTTWYCLAVYIASIFTSLAAHWNRRYECTAAEVQTLREDMGIWLLILTETGNLMGCGISPRDAVSSIIDRTIAWIEHDRIHKGSTSVPPPAPPISQEMLKHSPRSPSYTTLPGNTHTTWQDWTAAVVDNQDRYSANALMSLGGAGSGGTRTTHGGGLNDSIVSSDLGIPVSVGLNGVNGANTVATTTSGMQWPLLLFSDGTGVGGP
ncbi:putative transcription factor protein [Eutypa lata UCREL1]|uniref:Putative transcription factor protein n=1 Tax=Eutypa lata (strain UCR-EL1) TaxID=1287681 RepID=M7SV76_EUTLA|nr:putative transcription factor protein [Eutypa lata UCREL1]